jgi:hypothetical protein
VTSLCKNISCHGRGCGFEPRRLRFSEVAGGGSCLPERRTSGSGGRLLLHRAEIDNVKPFFTCSLCLIIRASGTASCRDGTRSHRHSQRSLLAAHQARPRKRVVTHPGQVDARDGAGMRRMVSRIAMAAMIPERRVSPPTTPIAHSKPKMSAIAPARSAPMA